MALHGKVFIGILWYYLLCWPLHAAAVRVEHSEEDASQYQSVPAIGEFTSLWKKKQEEYRKSSPVAGFDATPWRQAQLILGSFSVPAAKIYRQVIRTTWMHEPEVCQLVHGQQPGCSVYTAFIIGGKGHDAQDFETDVLLLNISENMNKGKTWEYFHHAVRAYPWATHIGKIDDDCYPFIRPLVTSFRDQRNHHLAYMGAPWSCKGGGGCPPYGCGYPVDNDFTKYSPHWWAYWLWGRSDECWSFMQGGFYAMSSELVAKISGEGEYWDLNKVGPEDLVTGQVVTEFGRRTGSPVFTWNPQPEAWWHMTSQWVSSEIT
mmetsp:Transcript_46772/g.102142  ORF Transcript_46772/g.102142 Transcript_46772/m.102142 type:complete len:318 (+) Transcript_46772:60-1013(+)|eukprot:CAMPEP_0180430720 /NCGR_PEP_ID=MMETSP1036_2-20121128/8031_1 /TAXON_ID=632150 /ORGANISM="Azadinium spinosum, Strain 3D9" /LENGTH=317 /DNA_ID=CAMNT_0022436463 /DNA_START=47 /DNA_END=1000 /DNA_ORIENTATION=-